MEKGKKHEMIKNKKKQRGKSGDEKLEASIHCEKRLKTTNKLR